MDDDFDAAVAIALLASSGVADEARGKPHVPCKAAATKKELTPEERAVESAKRKGERHALDARGEAAAVVATAQQEEINARVKVATREALLYLGVNLANTGLSPPLLRPRPAWARQHILT
ncbi:hypothetical protein D1007_25233 [Hordeum vulgare]|nr:hypothetical protein D1007_25233 [Hordeum vulgare]